MTDGPPGSAVVQPAADPSNAAVAFITTEHFTLQGARAATIADSIGRATMFVGSLSGGLLALGLVAAAAHIGTVFYAFGLIAIASRLSRSSGLRAVEADRPLMRFRS
jgi:hypothetical protein